MDQNDKFLSHEAHLGRYGRQHCPSADGHGQEKARENQPFKEARQSFHTHTLGGKQPLFRDRNQVKLNVFLQ